MDHSLRSKLENHKVDVIGFPYTIEFVEKLQERFNVSGTANMYGNIIQIEPTITNLDVLSTLIHEILELILRKSETPVDHGILSKFEIFFMMIMIRNPRLLEIILHEVKKAEKERSKKDRRKKSSKRMGSSNKRKSK